MKGKLPRPKFIFRAFTDMKALQSDAISGMTASKQLCDAGISLEIRASPLLIQQRNTVEDFIAQLLHGFLGVRCIYNVARDTQLHFAQGLFGKSR